MLNAASGWALAALAIAAGTIGYGWRGVALAATVVVFWLLLQFGRSLRVLRTAAANPVGQVPNAVMLHARLRRGMRLPQILEITRSLGRKLDEAGGGESWGWIDAGGDEIRISLRDGRVTGWELVRATT